MKRAGRGLRAELFEWATRNAAGITAGLAGLLVVAAFIVPRACLAPRSKDGPNECVLIDTDWNGMDSTGAGEAYYRSFLALRAAGDVAGGGDPFPLHPYWARTGEHATAAWGFMAWARDSSQMSLMMQARALAISNHFEEHSEGCVCGRHRHLLGASRPE